jgi:hypothetical protein
MVAPAAPLLQLNVLLPVPPEAMTVILPVVCPEHEALVVVPEMLIADGAVSVPDAVPEQP